MLKRVFRFALTAAILIAPPLAAARKIPGINEKDPYPKGCVDCHVKTAGMPAPLSADLKDWTSKVDAALLAKLQAVAPKGMQLKGKHPNVAAMTKEIPASCTKCHAKGSKMAPSLASIVHELHLAGGDKNTFVAKFDGECTYCHKFNEKTAEWTIVSGAEK